MAYMIAVLFFAMNEQTNDSIGTNDIDLKCIHDYFIVSNQAVYLYGEKIIIAFLYMQ